MKFSVVTISFNQIEFLEEALKSVFCQKGVEIEFIVVDPGSTDGSRELIDRYREQIDHVLFEPDAGPADGLNKGFALATGDIYCYLNSDDVFETDAFRRVADFLLETPIYMSSADMLGSSTKLVIGFEEFGQILTFDPL